MKTIVVFNQKGGVGKTSTVLNVAAELSTQKKKRVLTLDLDAQCNLTSFCGIRDPEKSVLDWLELKADFATVVQKTKYCDIIPAIDELHYSLLKFAAIPTFVIRLRDLIAAIPHDDYDFLLIDCPPAVNQLTAAALVAADYVLIPTEAEYFSASGVEKIAETIEQVKSMNEKLKVLGILLVKYNRRRTLTGNLEDLLTSASKGLFGCDVLSSKIRFTVDIPASQAAGLSVRDYKEKSKAVEEYSALVSEILNIIKE